MTTSANPSPFTSPALETLNPNWAPSWSSPVEVQAGVDEGPDGDPR